MKLFPLKAKERLLTPPLMCAPLEVFLDPGASAYEISGVSVVLLHSRGDGEDVRVDDDVERRHASLVDEQVVCPFSDGRPSLEGGSLPLLVETHNDGGRPKAPNDGGLLQEDLLALLERDGVDDGLALHTFESLDDDLPVRRINHHRHTSDVWLGSDDVEEGFHLVLGVEQCVVHVDIDDKSPVGHLLPCDGHSLVVFFLIDESEEFP